MSILPSKTKKAVFQVLNRTKWTQNKALKSGMVLDARCLWCETMEHLLYGSQHYSAKIWELAGLSMTLAISGHMGEYIRCLVLNPLEIVYNKPPPSILFHIKDATTRKILILFLHEMKRDNIFHHAQLSTLQRWEELQPHI